MKNLLLISVLLLSCSQIDKKKGHGVEGAKPVWVNDLSSECQSQLEICGVGEGKSLSGADQAARAALAAYFETEVKKNFKSFSSMDNESYEQVASESLDTLVDKVLVGSKIVLRGSFDSVYYSLAKVDKRVLSKKVKAEIEEIYEKFQKNLRGKYRLSYLLLKKNYEDLSPLYLEFLLINGREYPKAIKFKDLIDHKDSAPVEVIFLQSENKELSKKVAALLSEVGHSLTLEKKEASVIIPIELKKKKTYFNVDGFEKWNFNLSLKSIKSGRVLGEVFIEKNIIGRNQQNSLDKLNNKLNKELEEKLQNLKI